MTRLLYYEDSHRDRFDAVVLESRPDGDDVVVVLDASAFYPGGGGQPSDRGTLGGRRVVDVTMADGVVRHRIDGPLETGGRVEGQVDWPRRFDLMQQHTGQHILSRAFVEEAKADTRSFHLGEEIVTIDVDHPGPDAALLARVEDRANRAVWSDHEVVTHVVSLERAREFPLRKAPDVEGDVRVVEVAGFDWSACGGTHVRRSGAVGVIAILGAERYKGGSRISFVCGGRVIQRLRQTSERLRGLCLEFTAGEEDLPKAIARLKADHKRLEGRLKPLLAESLAREAQALVESAERGASVPVVARYFADRDPAELSVLAGAIVAQGGVALLAAGTPIARAHFSAPKGTIAVDALLAALGRTHGLKGGGRPESAQGALAAERALDAIEAARRDALAGTNQG